MTNNVKAFECGLIFQSELGGAPVILGSTANPRLVRDLANEVIAAADLRAARATDPLEVVAATAQARTLRRCLGLTEASSLPVM